MPSVLLGFAVLSLTTAPVAAGFNPPKMKVWKPDEVSAYAAQTAWRESNTLCVVLTSLQGNRVSVYEACMKAMLEKDGLTVYTEKEYRELQSAD